MTLPQLVGERESVRPGHSEIDERKVGLGAIAESFGLGGEIRLANDFHAIALAEQEGELVQRERLVIDDDRLQGHRSFSVICIQSRSLPDTIRGTSRSSATERAPVSNMTDRSS